MNIQTNIETTGSLTKNELIIDEPLPLLATRVRIDPNHQDPKEVEWLRRKESSFDFRNLLKTYTRQVMDHRSMIKGKVVLVPSFAPSNDGNFSNQTEVGNRPVWKRKLI